MTSAKKRKFTYFILFFLCAMLFVSFLAIIQFRFVSSHNSVSSVISLYQVLFFLYEKLAKV